MSNKPSSVISSHTRYSAKSQNTNTTTNSANNLGDVQITKTKLEIAQQKIENDEDDIINRYYEQQEKHRLLILQNQKRRKLQEKKQKEEIENKKKQAEDQLKNRKDTKQQAYVKFLRNNTNKIVDSLKQNIPVEQPKVKAQTTSAQMRPIFTVKTQFNNEIIAQEQLKPKKQWNTAKISSQNNQQDNNKLQTLIQNREAIPLELYYQDQKNNQRIQNNNKQEKYGEKVDLKFDALDLNIPQGKDDFEKIKKMYAQQQKDNGHEFIVNFEQEWNDDDESITNKQSKLLDSLDLSTTFKRNVQNQKNNKNLEKQFHSEFDNIQENDSFDEDEYRNKRLQSDKKNQDEQDQKDLNKQNDIEMNLNYTQQKSKTRENNQNRFNKQEQINLTGQNSKNEDRINTNNAQISDNFWLNENLMNNKNEINDSHKIQKHHKIDNLETKKELQKLQDNNTGLTEIKLQKHNQIIEGVISLENQKYDVLGWDKNQQKYVEDAFSNINENIQNKQMPLQLNDKLMSQEKRNLQNNLTQKQVNTINKQVDSEIKSQVSEEKMQRQNIRQLSAQKNKQNQDQQKERYQSSDQLSKVSSSQSANHSSISKNQDAQTVPIIKNKQVVPEILRPQIPIPPSKQKYQMLHSNKIQQNNKAVSDISSQSSDRVSKFKQKLQWNVEKNRRNNTKSPDSVCTRDEDLNVEEFIRDDLININKEEKQLQQEIYALHFDNIEKIRDIQNKNNINLNLVSSKQIKEIQNNPSVVMKSIKPINEYGEDELEKSLLRLDIALAKKQNRPFSSTPFQQQSYPQLQYGESSNQNSYQQIKQQQKQQNQQNNYSYQKQNTNPQIQQSNISNQIQSQIDQNNMLLQQQNQLVNPNIQIAQQLLILQQQQQILLNQQQISISPTLLQGNLIGLNQPPLFQVNKTSLSNNEDNRRQKLKNELDEEVESRISELKSKISSQSEKDSINTYKQKHFIKKQIKQKKQANNKEDKQQTKDQQENSSGIIKFNPKLKALLLDNINEEQNFNNDQESFFE